MSPHETATGVEIATAVAVIKTLTLLLGGTITYLAWKAYRRTGSPSLRALAAGFGIVTLGSLFGGLVDHALGVDLAVGILVESLLVLVGFAVIVYSLRVQ